jgi:hypothetical protein
VFYGILSLVVLGCLGFMPRHVVDLLACWEEVIW